MRKFFLKTVVRLRMLYADIWGHHGKKWNYEPGYHYMRGNKNKKKMTVGFGLGMLLTGLIAILVGGLAVWYIINNYVDLERDN